MAEPITIPLSVPVQERFAVLREQAAALDARTHEAVSWLVATVVDPDHLTGWSIDLRHDAIVCTPPTGDA